MARLLLGFAGSELVGLPLDRSSDGRAAVFGATAFSLEILFMPSSLSPVRVPRSEDTRTESSSHHVSCLGRLLLHPVEAPQTTFIQTKAIDTMPATTGEGAGNGAGAGAPAPAPAPAAPKRHRARLPPARNSAGRGTGNGSGNGSSGRSAAGRGRGGSGAGRRPAGTSANGGGGGSQTRSTGTGSASGSGSSSTLGSAVLRESSVGGTSGTSAGANSSPSRAQQTNRLQSRRQPQQQSGGAAAPPSPNRQPSQARRPGPGQQSGRGGRGAGGARSSVRGGGGGRGGRSTPTRGPSRRPGPPGSGPSVRGSGNRSMHGSRSSHGNGSISALRDPTALFRMLESGLDQGKGTAGGGGGGGDQSNQQQGGAEQEAKPMTRLEEIRRAERLDKMYRAVREWLRSNSNNPANMPSSPAAATPPLTPADPALKHAAATHLGMFGMTPLHLLCKLPNPPVDIVADLIETAPETLQWAESSGWLPLHLAVASGASLTVLEMLCDAHPDGKIAQDRRLRTPLHFGKSLASWKENLVHKYLRCYIHVM